MTYYFGQNVEKKVHVCPICKNETLHEFTSYERDVFIEAYLECLECEFWVQSTNELKIVKVVLPPSAIVDFEDPLNSFPSVNLPETHTLLKVGNKWILDTPEKMIESWKALIEA